MNIVGERMLTYLRMVHQLGGECTWTSPISTLSASTAPVQNFFHAIQATFVYVATCAYNTRFKDEWLLVSSDPAFASIGCTCKCPGGPTLHSASLRGQRNNVTNVPGNIPALPDELAFTYARIASQWLDQEPARAFMHKAALLLPAAAPRVAQAPSSARIKPLQRPKAQLLVNDGGGIGSTGDWSVPPVGETDVLSELRTSLIRSLLAHELPHKLVAHSELAGTSCPFPAQAISEAQSLVQDLCKKRGLQGCTQIRPEQPFLLNIIGGLQSTTHDEDVTSIPAAKSGVSAGVGELISPSRCMAPTPTSDLIIEPELVWCAGNWQSADLDPDLTTSLIEEEKKEGFIFTIPGGEEEARRRWPGRVAKGKVGVQLSDGRDPRFVLDTTVSGGNPSSNIPEKPPNPGPL